jgi:cell division protein FtsW
MAIGLVMVASTSASLDRSLLSPPLLRSAFGRQMFFVVVGLVVMLITSRAAVLVLASSSLSRRVTQVLFAITLGCLVVALLPGFGDSHRGSHRWLSVELGGMELGFQPSEFAKLTLVAMLAWLLTGRGADPRSLRGCFLPGALAVGACVLLVGKEDFGTAVLLAGVGVSMLFVAGCRLRHLAVLGGLGACAMTALLYAAPYRLARLAAYKDYWADPRGDGYQPLQSLATIASGGWFGTGLGSGVQKYGYLPESHSDFIFAVICEELGVFGAVLVMALFGVLVWLGLRTMLAARSRFERLLAFGLAATLGIQAAMNMAVVTVATPTTGISLPLISAGGSGVFAFCLATGVLAAVAMRSREHTRVSLDADGAARAENAPAWERETALW